MKKAGRPEVPKNKAFAPGISLRLQPNDRRIIEKAIAQTDLSRSEWARKALLYVAEHGIGLSASGAGGD